MAPLRIPLPVLVSAVLVGCFGGSPPPPPPPPGVTSASFGTLQRKFGRLELRQAVDRLPLVPSTHDDIEHNFGVCFDYRGGTQLRDLAVIVRAPGAISTDSVQLAQQQVEGGVRLALPRLRQYSGTYCQAMFFERGDPPGTWVFDLVQGATLLARWSVDVQPP